jgi:hypothetical protein
MFNISGRPMGLAPGSFYAIRHHGHAMAHIRPAKVTWVRQAQPSSLATAMPLAEGSVKHLPGADALKFHGDKMRKLPIG